MLLLVFGILAAISLVVVALGFLVDIPFYSAIGFFFLFLLGLSLQGGGVTASSQSNETYSYLCGCCQNNTFVTSTQTFCSGTPYSCDHWDLDQTNCEHFGCLYNTTSMFCIGNSIPCESLTSGFDCEYANCQRGTTTGCTNETEVILDKITKTSNETPLSDQNTIWIGRFLAFASAFAMILVFTHWKKGNIVK